MAPKTVAKKITSIEYLVPYKVVVMFSLISIIQYFLGYLIMYYIIGYVIM